MCDEAEYVYTTGDCCFEKADQRVQNYRQNGDRMIQS